MRRFLISILRAFLGALWPLFLIFECFVEGRHGSERWANLAAFSEATELFRFRAIPGVEVTTKHFILYGGNEYNILSVENVKGRNMYVEVLAKRLVSSNG